ncbi:hypothetical protein CRUP_005526 [Coryphaenoides rupestris]|nr:hypothetical protein CRUP_005526 [Coryphaenoides rupestris]
MAACRGSSSTKWLLTREQLDDSPSRRCGVEPDRELSYRQQAGTLIQDMGQRLNVISPTALFLAAKVEEQPRKLEHVIKVSHACLNPQEPPLDSKSNYKPTVIACVCIHLACKWSNWVIRQLTHEFLQILEKTPSRLKRIRNWRFNETQSVRDRARPGRERVTTEADDRYIVMQHLRDRFHTAAQTAAETPGRRQPRISTATQAAKKPKGDCSADGSFSGPSLGESSLLDSSMTSSSSSSSSNPCFPKPSTSFPLSMTSTPLSADGLAGPYSLTVSRNWPQAGYTSTPLKQEPPGPQEPTLSLQTTTASLLPHPPYRTEKGAGLTLVKHEHKGGTKHPPTNPLPPSFAAPFPPPPQAVSPLPTPQGQRLSLDKYREKQRAVAEDSSHSSTSHSDHRKHLQPHPASGDTPAKAKHHSSSTSGHERRHHGDKRDKGGVHGPLKLRLPLPNPNPNPGGGGSHGNREELKMKIKVSATERHSSSDESVAATAVAVANSSNNNSSRSKHSSPLVSKEKHARGGGDHGLLRHQKHAGHAHSGNGSGPAGVVATETAAMLSSTLLSRKRAHPEQGLNQHPSSSSSSSGSSAKASKGSKGGAGAAGGLWATQQAPAATSEPTHEAGEQTH